jgi:uncharacterized C2H2 Zn-finger protein
MTGGGCPRCGGILDLYSEESSTSSFSSGRYYKCRECGTIFRVP